MLALVVSALTGLPAAGSAPPQQDVRAVSVGGTMKVASPYVGERVSRIELDVSRVAEAARALVQAQKASEKELKIYGRTPGRLGATRSGHVIIRGPQELAKFTRGLGANIDDVVARVAKLLKTKEIDWKRQMIVVISGGTQRSGGYSVEVTSAKVKDDTLTINWKLNGPRPGQFVTQAITHPALTILVDRFDGTVEFNPPQAKSSLKKGID